MVTRVERVVDVAGVGHIAVTVFVPESGPADLSPAVLFLFPGGGYGRRYFDLQLDGLPDHSQAQRHASRGLVTVTVDHLGVGDSTVPARDDPRGPLTYARVAEANHAAVVDILGQVRAGTLDGVPAIPSAVAIGAGQSMGGHVAAVMQANHATFDGICALGSSFTQLRGELPPGKRRPFRALPSKVVHSWRHVDEAASFHWREEPAWVVAADLDNVDLAPWRSATVPPCAAEALKPFALAREAALVRVPVLLIYGEIDVTPEPLANAAIFCSAPEVAVYLVPRSAHMHNFAPTRHLVWARLEHFVDQVVMLRNVEESIRES